MLNFLRRWSLPSKAQIEEWERETEFTPDVWKIEMQEFVYLFEYGEAMREHIRYDIIDQSSYFGATAFTVADNFAMWYHRLGKATYPIAMEVKKNFNIQDVKMLNLTQGNARVRGELHHVRPQALFELDTHRLNGIQFIRKPILLDIPFRKELKIIDVQTGHYTRKMTGQQHHNEIEAFMYVGNPEYWSARLDAGFNFPQGAFIQPEGPKSKPFYYFSNKMNAI